MSFGDPNGVENEVNRGKVISLSEVGSRYTLHEIDIVRYKISVEEYRKVV